MEQNLNYNFLTSSPREDTNAEKYKLREKLFGTDDVLPVWVADMDIDTPEFVLKSVKKRLESCITGYEEIPKSAFQAQIKWMREHHNFEFALDDVFYSPSVVASMNLVIDTFTKEGDRVIVQTPVYPPFFSSVKNHKRKVINNPLKLEDDRYTFDIDDLKNKIDKNTKLLLLCSPHNPVGKVWKKEELEAILDVCLKNDILVFSDEIHCDLVYEPHKHIPFASLSKKAKEITITAIGVGKTFNMAGFAMSSIVIQNEFLKEKFLKKYNKIHFGEGCILSHVAFESAYKNGNLWLKELKKHLYNNYQMLKNLCDRYEFIKLTPIEATYLVWLDCNGMNLSNKELKEFFVKEAKLGPNMGIAFGRAGSGYVRLNFAVSYEKINLIIKFLDTAFKNFNKLD
jgi:cystathionine beta-lyase